RLPQCVERAVGLLLAELAPERVRVRASGEARLEQEIGELVEQGLEVDRVGQLGEIAAVRRVFHRAPYPEYRAAASFPAMDQAPPFRLGALSHRNFRLFFFGQGLSLIATWMQSVAPGCQAFIVELVRRDDLMTAIALNSSMFNAARIVGPAVAGVLIGAAGVGMCFFLNGVSYLAVIAGLLAMRLPPFVRHPVRATAWQGLAEAVRFIRGDARVMALVVLVAVFSVLGFPFLVLMPVVARDVLHTDARGYGLLMAAVGVGAMLGALALAIAGRRVHKGRALLDGGAAFGALLVLFAAVRSVGVALVLLALAGCAMIVTTALANTMLQTLVPNELRGRVMAFYAFVFVGMAPLGAFQAGLVAEHTGAPFAIALGGIGCLIGAALVAWRVPALRKTG